MLNKPNNFLQDNDGNYSMARFAVMCCVVLGLYNGAWIPFADTTIANTCMQASLGYMGIATAAKAITKVTERK